ncbi:MAG: SDR family oxidoreductase [Actinomycetota bacterium]
MGTAPSFDGRVALITGGTQGLGYAVASLLKEKGASGLMLVGRDAAKGLAAAASLTGDGCRAEFVSVDLSDPDGPAQCVAATDEAFGTVHATVNCAAATFRGSVWDSTAAMWDEMLALNVRAAALVAQESARLMVREGVDGSIVLIGSVARHGGNANLLPYSASKMALVAATRNMAYSLMRHRVRVNMLNPGWMDTPAEDITQREHEGATDGWLERAEAEQPMGKLIKPHEIAHTIVHLCSPESGFLTGQDIDWDQTVLGVGPGVRPGPELGELPDGFDG